MNNNTSKMILTKLNRMDVSDVEITNHLVSKGYPITRSAIWRQRTGEIYKAYNLNVDNDLLALLQARKDFIAMVEGVTK